MIISSGSITTAAMKRATSSIPVVFVAVNEPVEQGFVASLAQPGGNITGFTLIDFTVIGKSVELLKAMAPALTRIGPCSIPTRTRFTRAICVHFRPGRDVRSG